MTILSTSGLPTASYSNVRLQKSKPTHAPPSVGSSVPNEILSNPQLAIEPVPIDSVFETAGQNRKTSPQNDDKVAGSRNARDVNWNENEKENRLDEFRNSKDIETGIIENINGMSQHYDDDDFPDSDSAKLDHEFDDDNASHDKFNYDKFKSIEDLSSGSENKTEDDLEKSNSFIGIYNGCCGGWGGGWGGYGGWGGWGGGWGGWGGGWGGWGGGWGGPWYG